MKKGLNVRMLPPLASQNKHRHHAWGDMKTEESAARKARSSMLVLVTMLLVETDQNFLFISFKIRKKPLT